jgi:hypothetical protein
MNVSEQSNRSANTRLNMPDHTTVESHDREKRVLLTASQERALNHMILHMCDATGESITFSKLLRAGSTLLLNARDEILSRCEELASDRAQFGPNDRDNALADVLLSGLNDHYIRLHATDDLTDSVPDQQDSQ